MFLKPWDVAWGWGLTYERQGGLPEEATVELRPVTQQLGLGGTAFPGGNVVGSKARRWGWLGLCGHTSPGRGQEISRNGFLWGSQEP